MARQFRWAPLCAFALLWAIAPGAGAQSAGHAQSVPGAAPSSHGDGATGAPASAPAASSGATAVASVAVAPASGTSKDAPAGPSLGQALEFFRSGQFDQAIATYNALLTAGYNPAIVDAELAEVYLKQHRVDDAFAAASKAMQLSPTYPVSKVAMGEVLFRQGQIPEAEKLFVEVINTGIGNARAYLGEARVSRAASYYLQAKTLIDQAYADDPRDPEIWQFYFQTLAGPERIAALKKYLAAQTNDDAAAREGLNVELGLLEERAAEPTHACHLVSHEQSMHTNLKALLNDPSHIRGAGLQVKLNGKNSTLLLDTGSSGILVDRKIAEKAGLKRIVETHIRGVGDKEAASGYVAQADKIQIGDLEFDDCMVEVMDRNSVLDDDGLIGADVFSSFLVDVNLPDWKFSLSPLPRRPDEKSAETPALASGRSNHAPQFHNRYIAPEMKDYTPIFRFGHQLLMPTAVNGAALKLFLLDTGAFGNAINPATAREFSKVSRDDDMKIKGLSGRVNDVFRAREVTLTFAHMRQKNQDLVSFDTTSLSNSTGTEVSGFLGFSLLAMLDMKIDYRDGLVDFTFDSNRYCRMNCN